MLGGGKYANFSYLCENSKHARSVLRKQIIKKGLIPYECALCGIKEWNGKTLSLELDHINGDASNSSRENVRLICPNCDSQLPTFKSRNKNSARNKRKEFLAENRNFIIEE